MVGRAEALRMFGVSSLTWLNWERAGTVRCAGWGRLTPNHRCKLYARRELRRLLHHMRGSDSVYRDSDRQFHIPKGFVGAEEAARMFGGSTNVLRRWEREGRIRCGKLMVGGKLMIYPIEELGKLLAECGRHAPPYPDPDRPGCWRVPLIGQEMHRREAVIDEQDLPLVQGRTCYWSGHEVGQVVVSVIDARLHQLIMGVSGKEWRVGHLNGDTLDCRRSNLVVRSCSESAAGMRKARGFCGKRCTSRFKGVCWDKRRGYWVVYIKKDQRQRNLGRFDDEITAAEAYDEAARRIFGEHARLNFPDGIDAHLERKNRKAA